MYQVLTLHEPQLQLLRAQLGQVLPTVDKELLAGNFIMVDAVQPTTIAITQELFVVLFEQVQFLREAENLIVPRPDTIGDSDAWQLLYGDEASFEKRRKGLP
jgi:hypothetical protein